MAFLFFSFYFALSCQAFSASTATAAFDKTVALLPTAMQHALQLHHNHLRLQAVDDGKVDILQLLCSQQSDDVVEGQKNILLPHYDYNSETLFWHHAFIDSLASAEKIDCGFGVVGQQLQAILLSSIVALIEQPKIDPRQSQLLYLLGYKWNSDEGFTLRNRWPMAGLGLVELLGSEQALSLQIAFYLMDPDYACKKPFLAREIRRYLSEQLHFFDSQIEQRSVCQREQKNILFPVENGAALDLVTVNPDKILRVDYLLAEPGSTLESMFGHSMLRLVICEDNVLNPNVQCLGHEQKHLVLSFQGEVLDFQAKIKKALTGKYKTQLWVYEFAEIKKQYTEDEGRDLSSYPLNLSREQIRALTQLAAEQAWNYQGQYFYLSNNCSVELADFLSVALGVSKLRSLLTTPNDLLSELKSRNMIAAGGKQTIVQNLNNPDVWYQQTHDPRNQVASFLYQAHANDILTYIRLLYSLPDNVKQSVLHDRLTEYLNRSSLEDRKKIVMQQISARPQLKKRLLQSAYNLENYLLAVNTNSSEKNLYTDQTGIEAEQIKQLNEQRLDFLQQLHTYRLRSALGYGIKQQFSAQLAEMAGELKKRATELLDKQNSILQKQKSQAYMKKQENIRFIEELKNEIRKM